MRKAAFPCRKNITARSWMYASYQTANLLLLLYHIHALLGLFDVNNSEMWSPSHSNNAASCELVYQSVASYGVIRPRFAEKVYFILLFAHFVLVHVIKRISNEISFHTMYYETRVFHIPSPEARGYKTHNLFHNTSYGMKIHLRSYICHDVIQTKFDFRHLWPTFTGVIALC